MNAVVYAVAPEPNVPCFQNRHLLAIFDQQIRSEQAGQAATDNGDVGRYIALNLAECLLTCSDPGGFMGNLHVSLMLLYLQTTQHSLVCGPQFSKVFVRRDEDQKK